MLDNSTMDLSRNSFMQALYQFLLRRACRCATWCYSYCMCYSPYKSDVRHAIYTQCCSSMALRSTCFTQQVHDCELACCTWRLYTAPVQRFVCKDWLYTLANRAFATLLSQPSDRGGGANPRNPFTSIPWGHCSLFL